MKHYNVVAAVIEHDGKILCMQKGQTKYPYTSFKWEFPGGKIELLETPEQALKRELLEEMSYEVMPIRSIAKVEHSYPDFSITLDAWLCSVKDSNFIMREHKDYRWLRKDQLKEMDWAEADADIIDSLFS